eukprot:s178_g16.t1
MQVLRFLRKSCEVSGRGAAAWWLSPDAKSAECKERWTAPAAVRRAVLSALGAGDVEPATSRTAEELLCGIEGLRTAAYRPLVPGFVVRYLCIDM